MKKIIVFFLLPVFQSLMAQPQVPGSGDNLETRYQSVKAKSESYQEYKVIKVSTLDGVWKMAMDSIRAKNELIRENVSAIHSLQAELRLAQLAVDEKESAMKENLYAATHISVLGAGIGKKAFVGSMAFLVGGLLLLMGLIFGKIKFMKTSLREKIALADEMAREFDAYKHKSLERQTKLSRELQTERNRLLELQRSQ